MTSPTGKPRRRANDAASSAEATVTLQGEVAGKLMQVRSSDIRLITVVGETEDQREVLVPLVEWRMFGNLVAEDDRADQSVKGPTISSHMLTLDNVAFLLEDMSHDVREAVRMLADQSRGNIVPLPNRVAYIMQMLNEAADNIASSIRQIEDNLVSKPDLPAPKPARSRR